MGLLGSAGQCALEPLEMARDYHPVELWFPADGLYLKPSVKDMPLVPCAVLRSLVIQQISCSFAELPQPH